MAEPPQQPRREAKDNFWKPSSPTSRAAVVRVSRLRPPRRTHSWTKTSSFWELCRAWLTEHNVNLGVGQLVQAAQKGQLKAKKPKKAKNFDKEAQPINAEAGLDDEWGDLADGWTTVQRRGKGKGKRNKGTSWPTSWAEMAAAAPSGGKSGKSKGTGGEARAKDKGKGKGQTLTKDSKAKGKGKTNAPDRAGWRLWNPTSGPSPS